MNFPHRIVAAVMLCFVLTAPASATKFWKNGVTSGGWGTGNNWSSFSAAGADNGGLPVANEQVRIVHTDGVARTVTLDVSPPSLGLVAIDLTGAGTAADTLLISSGSSLTAAALLVGGHNGVTPTAGRGEVFHSAGTLAMSLGADFVLGHGAGSTGTYHLSGAGALNVPQSLYVGLSGSGTVNHFGGTVTVAAGAIGSLDIAVLAGSTGAYNLGGTGSLTSNKSVYVGDQGIGVFTQTGGTATVGGANDLTLGFAATGSGTYDISGGSLSVGDDLIVGLTGQGSLSITGTADVQIGDTLFVGDGVLNLSGGKLRLGGLSGASLGDINYTGGLVQVPGDRTLNVDDDALVRAFFPSGPGLDIEPNKGLIVEGRALITNSNDVEVNGGTLKSLGAMEVYGAFLAGSLDVLNGGLAEVGSLEVGVNASDPFQIADVKVRFGSTLRSTNGIILGGGDVSFASLAVRDGSLVDAGTILSIAQAGLLTLDNSTLRFRNYSRTGSSSINYTSGVVQMVGHRTIGSDAAVTDFFGATPVVPFGKTLFIEGIATLTTTLAINRGHFKANSLVVAPGGDLDFQRGILEINGGVIQGMTELIVPTNGEYRGRGEQYLRIIGATGSTMTATGPWAIGELAYFDAFYSNGKFNTGPHSVTILDANAAVFDSGASVTMGGGSTPGVLDIPNGLILDFGGTIQGFGTIATPNDPTKPFINNGSIYATSAGITLTGYVKGVGTFSNVIITGTLSPGLSPATQRVESLSLGGTLVMELGGATPGSGYDQLIASGNLAVGGTLEVQLLGGFAPSAGQSFNLLDWGSLSGTFSSLNLPALGAGLSWNTSQLYATGVLSVAAAGLTGDYNNDGLVDAADYSLWRDGGPLQNETASIGVVDAADYTAWSANYGATSSTIATAVPEPPAGSIVALALIVFAWRHRDARQCVLQ